MEGYCENGNTEVYGDDGQWHDMGKSVEVVADRVGTLHVEKKYAEPSMWQNFVGWLNDVEAGMRGNAYWTFGIEFKTSTGESNGQTANPVKSKDWENVLTIDNWDEASELLDILGVVQSSNAQNNPFNTYKITKPTKEQIDIAHPNLSGRQKNAISSNLGQIRKTFNEAENWANPNPGSSQLGFTVNGSSEAPGDTVLKITRWTSYFQSGSKAWSGEPKDTTIRKRDLKKVQKDKNITIDE